MAASRDPTNSPHWVTLAGYQLAAGQYVGAQQSAAQAIMYLPWYPAALNDLGIASLALGENADAHNWFAYVARDHTRPATRYARSTTGTASCSAAR